MEQLPATIHTFGFGYNLRSGLLKSIAEFGNGDYSFIPDAGMIVSLENLNIEGRASDWLTSLETARALYLFMPWQIFSRLLPTMPL